MIILFGYAFNYSQKSSLENIPKHQTEDGYLNYSSEY
jgi:hypothetical protein